MRFTIVIKGDRRTYRAYCPDLPTLMATGDSLEEAKRNFRATIADYCEDLTLTGASSPRPRTLPRDITLVAPDEVVDTVEIGA